MRNATTAVLLALAVAVTASAETAIAFHVTLTDGRTALQANPNFADLKISDEQLQRAAGNRVLLLDRTAGTKWTWLILNWMESHPDAENGLNESGVAAVGKNADVGVTPIDDHTFRVRCLRERCEVTIARDAEKQTVTLRKDQSQTAPFDSDVRVVF